MNKKIILFFLSLVGFSKSESCSKHPPPVINYIEKFDNPVNFDETLYVYCNDTITVDMELKPIKFTAKNIVDEELCRLWLPGGIQIQFLSSQLTNSDVIF